MFLMSKTWVLLELDLTRVPLVALLLDKMFIHLFVTQMSELKYIKKFSLSVEMSLIFHFDRAVVCHMSH